MQNMIDCVFYSLLIIDSILFCINLIYGIYSICKFKNLKPIISGSISCGIILFVALFIIMTKTNYALSKQLIDVIGIVSCVIGLCWLIRGCKLLLQGKNWMSFAIEITSQWYELYDIKVTNNGSEIDGSVDILTGSVCIDDKFHRFDSSLTGSEYDNFLYTIIIKTNDDISVDDIVVNATTHYNSVGSGVSEDMSLIVNSNISEITARQSVIHENTLFEVDEKPIYIHRCNFTIIDTALFDNAIKSE